jgi:hypothetical protein
LALNTFEPLLNGREARDQFRIVHLRTITGVEWTPRGVGAHGLQLMASVDVIDRVQAAVVVAALHHWNQRGVSNANQLSLTKASSSQSLSKGLCA